MTSIVGKTNGANSSEYRLAQLAIITVAALSSIAVAAGVFAPEHATALNEAAKSITENVVSIVIAYGSLRSILKSVIAWRDGQAAPVSSEVKE